MKSRGTSTRHYSSSTLPPQLPIAWMDPMSWRLPSGKALAEFALQSGFLAPLLLSGPSKRKKTTPIPIPVKSLNKQILDKERTETSGSFRETR